MMLSSLCQTIDDEIIIVYLPYLNRVISRWLIVKVDDFVGLSGGQSTSLIVSRSKRPTFSFVLLLLTLLIPLLSHLSFFFPLFGATKTTESQNCTKFKDHCVTQHSCMLCLL